MINMLDMGMVYSYAKMVITMDTGKIINRMGPEKRSITMVIVLRVNGMMMKFMDKLKLYLKMEQYMKEILKTICKTASAKNRAPMGSTMWVIIKMELNMGKAKRDIRMERATRETMWPGLQMGKVYLYGPMGRGIKGSGRIIRGMGLGFSQMLMGQKRKDNGKRES